MMRRTVSSVPLWLMSTVLAISTGTFILRSAVPVSSVSGGSGRQVQAEASSPSAGTFAWGGRIHIDATTYTYTAMFPASDSSYTLYPNLDVRLRRLRLYTKGKLAGAPIHWKFQLEFAGGRVRPRTIFIQYSLASLHIRVGQMKEPIGLERLTSSNHITFVERSLPTQIQPDRNLGISLHTSKQIRGITLGIQGGIFLPHSRPGRFRTDTMPAFAVTWRLACLTRSRSRSWLQTGIAYSYRPVPNGLFTIPDWQPEIARAHLPPSSSSSVYQTPPTQIAQSNLLTWDLYTQLRNLFIQSEISGLITDPGLLSLEQGGISQAARFTALVATLHLGYALHLNRRSPTHPTGGLPGFQPVQRSTGLLFAVRLSYGQVQQHTPSTTTSISTLWATTSALTLYFTKQARLTINYTYGKKNTTATFQGVLLRAQLTFQQKTKTPHNP